MAAIVLEGLKKAFERGGAAALAGVDLAVGDGELLVLVGPSGCGKSTVLRIIAGLETPSAGRVLIDGRDVLGVAPQHRDVAMVFQGYALYPHLTVRENLAFPLKMRGVAKAAREEKVAEIAALVGLAGKLERLPAQLSGGERQRVAMGRAIVRQPRVFLFDEPLSNLDAKLRAELRVELCSLVKRLGVTSIYVTHDQAEAMTMSDRVAVMNLGELQQVAPPRRVYEEPANTFVAGFVGTPAMNLLALDFAERKATAAGVTLRLPAWLDARDRAVVGFRPEHAILGDAAGGAAIAANVTSTEPLGPETLVYLRAGEHDLRARVPGFGGPAAGDDVTVSVAPGHLLWFHHDGGHRLEEGGR
jgi:multiple sugar transport system ATP-binding protein